MQDRHSITGSVSIDASREKVWDVLTNPEKIVLYLGSNTITDWKAGSPIVWEGEFGGNKFQDKGTVLENKIGTRLKFSYWTGAFGSTETEQNYSVITYNLDASTDGQTTLSYTRDAIPSAMEKAIFEEHLPSMLEKIRRLSEEN